MIDQTREALELISCGAIITYAGAYTVRLGVHGDYLQKFQLCGWRRKYTRNPSTANRRMYQIAGWLAVSIGLVASGAGLIVLVNR
jgi:hypothetical protein